jgi:CheY-like chemotaxis protein
MNSQPSETSGNKIVFVKQSKIKNNKIIFDSNISSIPPDLKWKILVVDDDWGTFEITTLALKNLPHFNDTLELYYAPSAAAAIKFLKNNHNVAIILLDIVMESNDAGLKVIDYVRDVQNDFFTQIVVRTGYHGPISENGLMFLYDIQGYLSKSELLAYDLRLTILFSLRNYIRQKKTAGLL